MFGPIIVLLAMFGIAILWCFFVFVPRTADKRLISVYNWTVLGVLVMICIPFCFYIDSFFRRPVRNIYGTLPSWGASG